MANTALRRAAFPRALFDRNSLLAATLPWIWSGFVQSVLCGGSSTPLGRLVQAEQFADIVLKTGSDGEVTYLRDVSWTAEYLGLPSSR